MSTPFDGFQQGLMTGTAMGTELRQRRNTRELGGLMSSGDMTGARNMAYSQGDLRTGQALDGQVSQQAAAQRGQQMTGALAQGDYDQALSFAQSPEELQQITEFRNTASEADRAAAVQRSEQIAMAVGAVQSLPPEQQLAAAQQAAARMGMDPNSITPDMVTPQALETMRMKALGLKAYLDYQQEERAAQRPIIGNGFISLPPGSSVPGGGQQPQSLGSSLPPGWTPQPRPNQAPSAPAAGGAERSQPVGVSFRSSQEAQTAIERIVPGVRITSGRRDPANNRRVGGSPGSLHLQDRARDLVPPAGLSMAQLEAKMRQAGFRVLNEGDHIHVSW